MRSAAQWFLIEGWAAQVMNIGHRFDRCLRQRIHATHHVVPPGALQAMSLETLGDFAQGGNVLGDIALVTRLKQVAPLRTRAQLDSTFLQLLFSPKSKRS